MIEFEIKNMSCGHCVGAVTKAVKQVDPAAEVQVDLATKKVSVKSAEPPSAFTGALAEAGYPTT
jgi:copper chaperone